MTKAYYCEESEDWWDEEEVSIEVNLHNKPTYVHFFNLEESVQLYHETRSKDID